MLPQANRDRPFASGPLRVSPRNPRYFEDAEGRIVYLTGSHTWNTLIDSGPEFPLPAFDFAAHLRFLQERNHNFIRLWTMDHFALPDGEHGGQLCYAAPLPWARTGPGEALDGRPKFDLTQYDPAYFQRLRERIIMAGTQGIYVSIMLFEGCEMHNVPASPWRWEGHPFHAGNNVNGLDGDPKRRGVGYSVHSLDVPEITAVQEAYVRHVVDCTNDLDNVLYEIINESAGYSLLWQSHLIAHLHSYEQTKPKQHPVGMTAVWGEPIDDTPTNRYLFESEAEWISPCALPDGYFADPPAADGSKVILVDSDHLEGRTFEGMMPWVWRSFCRGLNPIYMDVDDNDGTKEPFRELPRKALGFARHYAERMDLAKAVPSNALASTQYCLSDGATQFLVFLPEGGTATVDLSRAAGMLNVEWLEAETCRLLPAGQLPGGTPAKLTAPFQGPAVLYLWRGR
jgi:hypothetical protein